MTRRTRGKTQDNWSFRLTSKGEKGHRNLTVVVTTEMVKAGKFPVRKRPDGDGK
jgi:hypothetical protein